MRGGWEVGTEGAPAKGYSVIEGQGVMAVLGVLSLPFLWSYTVTRGAVQSISSCIT